LIKIRIGDHPAASPAIAGVLVVDFRWYRCSTVFYPLMGKKKCRPGT